MPSKLFGGDPGVHVLTYALAWACSTGFWAIKKNSSVTVVTINLTSSRYMVNASDQTSCIGVRSA